MKLQTSINNDATVLTLSGEFGAESVPRFNHAVAEAFAAQRRDFIVDLQQVTAVDSASLEAFTALQRQCDEQLGMAQFCRPNETLLKIFEITRLDKQLALRNNVDDALINLGQGDFAQDSVRQAEERGE